MRIYGINPIIEAFRAGLRPDCVHLLQGKANPGLDRIRELCTTNQVPCELRRDFNALIKHGAHQGALADIPIEKILLPPPVPFDDGPLVMLDGLEDPHNFGAALRVCECFGIREVIYQKDNSCGLTASSIKVSTGAAFHLRLRLARLNKIVKRLKDSNIPLVVLENGAATSLYDLELPPQYCVVVGSEGKGVRNTLKRQADYLVEIPMQGRVNSLNVSCALTAVLAQLRRP